jgi:hypothetical protein
MIAHVHELKMESGFLTSLASHGHRRTSDYVMLRRDKRIAAGLEARPHGGISGLVYKAAGRARSVPGSAER